MQDLNRSFVRLAIFAVTLAFVCKGIFYSALIPIWEGYDEYAHFAFIQQLDAHGELPTPDTRVSREIDRSLELAPLPWELRDLPSPHIVHDLFWKLPPDERLKRQQDLLDIPVQLQSEAGTTALYEGKQGPLYYWLMWPLYHVVSDMTLPNRVFLFRIVNVLLGSLVIPIAFAAARTTFASARIGLAASALIASMPELYMDSFRVGNQTLTIVLYGLFTWFCLKSVVIKQDYLPAAGITLGLLLITRAYSVAAIPAMLFVALWTIWAARSNDRKRALLVSGVAFALPVLIAGWWYIRNLRLVGSIIWYDAVPAHPMRLAEIARHVLNVKWRSAFASLFGSHIWFGNWSFLTVRSWMYDVIEYIALLSVAGLVIAAIRNRRKLRGSENVKIAVLVAIYGFFLLSTAYHILMNSINQGVDASAGWYLYSVIVAEVLLFVAGFVGFGWGKAVVACVSGLFFLLEMYTTHFLLIPYYTGLIAHAPDGGLQSFHVSQLSSMPIAELLDRLQVNRASLVTDWTLLIFWSLFVAAAVILPCVAVRAAAHDAPKD